MENREVKIKKPEEIAQNATYFSIVINIFLCLGKWLAGVFGNSFALIADAIESTVDVFASFLVLFGIKFSSKPADENHPYGHGRIEPLITFIVVVFLILSATLIIFQSIENIKTPHELPKPWTLIVLLVIIVWKELSFRYVLKKGKESNSSAVQADAWHHRSDAITSLAAFVGICIALVGKEGYESADDWAAIFAAVVIYYNAYNLFRNALSEFMDENIFHDFIEEIKQESLDVEGIIEIEKCIIRKVGMKYMIMLHAIVKGDISVHEGHLIGHNLKDFLIEKHPEINDVMVHIEPDEYF